MQAGLAEAMAAARYLGFRVGLHTAGPSPERLRRILPLVDWIGFDVKAPFADYPRVTGAAGSGRKARASLEAVIAAGVAFEVRTAVHPRLTGPADLARLDADLAQLGLGPTRRQPFRAHGCADPELAYQGRAGVAAMD